MAHALFTRRIKKALCVLLTGIFVLSLCASCNKSDSGELYARGKLHFENFLTAAEIDESATLMFSDVTSSDSNAYYSLDRKQAEELFEYIGRQPAEKQEGDLKDLAFRASSFMCFTSGKTVGNIAIIIYGNDRIVLHFIDANEAYVSTLKGIDRKSVV